MVAPAYAEKYGVDDDEHAHGAGPHRVEEPLQRRPQPARPVPQGDVASRQICDMPRSRRRSSACSTAPAWPTAPPPRSSCRAEDAHRYTDKPLYVKALSFVAGNGSGLIDPTYDYTTFPEIAACARRRLRAGRHHRPASRARHGRGARLLHAHRAGADGGPRASAERGAAWKDVLDGVFDLDGELPVNPDGGLKSLRPPRRRVAACG